jgi:heme A synthase
MKKMLPLGIAVNGIIIILSSIIIFHFLVLTGVIPFNIVWGGNLTSKTQLYTMEAISIAINTVMLLIILTYCGVIKSSINRKYIIGAIWCMFLLFVLNTLGNLMAKTSLETYIFTPLTSILAIFCFRIAAFEHQQKKFSV